MTVRIALVRHGQTDWNAAGLMQGRTDIPLNAVGLAQARELGERLAAGEAWDAVVASPLDRASGTARVIAERIGAAGFEHSEHLIERSFGEAEGLAVEDAYRRWPSRAYPGMETDDAVAERAMLALEDLAARFPGSRVLAVSHGAFIRHLIAHVAGVPVGEVPRIENVAVSRLSLTDRSGEPAWRIDDIAGAPFARR